MTTKEKLVLVIDRYEGDIRSSPKYLQMLKDNLPEGYELVLMSDKEYTEGYKGIEIDQVWFDEFASMEVKEVLTDPFVLPKEKPYWQRTNRWA